MKFIDVDVELEFECVKYCLVYGFVFEVEVGLVIVEVMLEVLLVYWILGLVGVFCVDEDDVGVGVWFVVVVLDVEVVVGFFWIVVRFLELLVLI